jgi:cysteine desulfurase
MIYADNASTTRPSPAAKDAVIKCLERFGNPSSAHALGIDSANLIKDARRRIKSIVNASDRDKLVFTSGGSESNNHAFSIAKESGKRKLIISAIEHDSVFNTANELEKQGFTLTVLGVDKNGLISLEELERCIDSETAMVSVMTVNNEIGTVMPISEIGAICRQNGVLFHTDAVQAVGNMHIDVAESNIDLMSFSAHKFGGLKGVGALYIRNGIKASPLLCGGMQENGLRAGTENTVGIAAMAAALEDVCFNLKEKQEYVKALRNSLENRLLAISGTVHNNRFDRRINGITNVSFPNINSNAMIMMLDEAGICVSSGAACRTAEDAPSRVLAAIGCNDKISSSAIRFSLTSENTALEVDIIANRVEDIVARYKR